MTCSLGQVDGLIVTRMEDIKFRWCFGLKFLQSRMFDESIEGFQSEHLTARRQEHFFHVFAPDPKAPSGNTRNYLEPRFGVGSSAHAKLSQVLNTGDLVPSGPIVFGDLCLDDDLWTKLVRHDEIRCLVKPCNSFCPF